jgi:hypothetical protein
VDLFIGGFGDLGIWGFGDSVIWGFGYLLCQGLAFVFTEQQDGIPGLGQQIPKSPYPQITQKIIRSAVI